MKNTESLLVYADSLEFNHRIGTLLFFLFLLKLSISWGTILYTSKWMDISKYQSASSNLSERVFKQFQFFGGNIYKKTEFITVYDCCKYQIYVLIIYICTAIEANVVIYQQLYVLIYCCSYLSLYTKSACWTSVKCGCEG